MSNIDKKGNFSSKKANIDLEYDSDIHFTITFKGLFKIFFFSGIVNSKNYSITFFSPEISIQKFEFGFIQFKKTFLQLENQGIQHRCASSKNMDSTGRLELQITVNKFHQCNHTSCGESFKSSEYASLGGKNTQSCEQTNAQLRQIATSCIFMNPDMFMTAVTMHLGYQNLAKKI